MPEFEQVMQELGPAVGRVVAAFATSPADREDLSQEVAVALLRALPRFRGESSLKTYVLRIAHNCAVRHIAKRRTTSVAMDETEHRHAGAGPEQAAAARQNAQRLLGLVRALPLGMREVLTLALEGLSVREVAEVLGQSENVVSVRLHRARKLLRARLADAPIVDEVQ